MGKAIGFDGPCHGQDPYPDDEKDRAYDEAFELIYQEVVTGLRKNGECKEHRVSMLDVFGNIVMTGIDTEIQPLMNDALHSLYTYRCWRSLRPTIDKEIEYIARITAERELEN